MSSALTKTFKTIKQHWLTVGFLLGFVTDYILLNSIDDLFDNLVLLFYALLSSVSVLLFYTGIAERGPQFFYNFLKRFAPLLMQYSFGGLLSGMLIFYGRSGDWLASWPFLLLIVAVVVGNEFIGKRSDKLIFHLALYFTGIYSYVVLVTPVLLGKMGDWIFILSGVVALVWVTFVVQILYKIIPNFMNLNTKRIIVTLGGVYIGFNVLYFTNAIPPIPLSLTKLEVAQSVVRQTNGNYRIELEEQAWYTHLPFIHPVIHPKNDSIACFARVYAPTKLSTKIFHRWEYQNEKGSWHEQFRFGYDIAGSNQGGYRGYTVLQNYRAGIWRCTVETERGQVLGREVFQIITIGPTGRLVTEIE